MTKIGNGSFAPQRRKENQIVSDLADQGLLLNGEVTVDTLLAFALTRHLNPNLLLRMYQQAGLLDPTISPFENDRYPDIYRSQC